jgi:ribosomal protein S18 acetylase RimI-like enzyme
MLHTLQFRPATSYDYTSIAALWDEALLPSLDHAEWETLIASPAATVLLAEDESGLAGAAVASFDGWRAYIYHVAVDPTSRRHGVGKALLQEAETMLIARGAREVIVMVPASNGAGIALMLGQQYEPQDCQLVLTKQVAPGSPGYDGTRRRTGVGLFH